MRGGGQNRTEQTEDIFIKAHTHISWQIFYEKTHRASCCCSLRCKLQSLDENGDDRSNKTRSSDMMRQCTAGWGHTFRHLPEAAFWIFFFFLISQKQNVNFDLFCSHWQSPVQTVNCCTDKINMSSMYLHTVFVIFILNYKEKIIKLTCFFSPAPHLKIIQVTFTGGCEVKGLAVNNDIITEKVTIRL